MSEHRERVSVSAETERMIGAVLTGRADALDVLDELRTELLQQLFNHYSEKYADKLACPHCGEPVQVKL